MIRTKMLVMHIFYMLALVIDYKTMVMKDN